MAMKVGVASVNRKKSSSLCLFFPRLRTLKWKYDKFIAYLHDSFYQFHLMLSIWFENFELISHMGKVL